MELLLDRSTAAWARNQIWHSRQQLTMFKDGRLRLALEVGDTQELLGWILHFGADVEVIKPESLKERVREEEEKILFQT